jgi:hypothetical protein
MLASFLQPFGHPADAAEHARLVPRVQPVQ